MKKSDKTIYISGAISKNPNYEKDFSDAVEKLKNAGYVKIINPCCLPSTLEYEQLMSICFEMINQSDVCYFMPNYDKSLGARREHCYAIACGKEIIYGD